MPPPAPAPVGEGRFGFERLAVSWLSRYCVVLVAHLAIFRR